MSESDARSSQFRGQSPPTHGEEWEVTNVSRRFTNREATTACAVTGSSVALDEPHYYVTVKRETVGRFQPPDYDHLIVAKDALDVLDGWLEDKA
ncbi:hypothetical protein [Halopiger xanaduensis]|uniref:Uncharacterized protein n=1 Tax=Halopiger xanaduensis (strain DSM 18323 / JCM 14033 / SH-6) TaxID=797210 RepID=F8DER2_HALXS|nr:hypothetical protein [Halopiger xanaduensis]AEH39501.1 hypothetical protein Halxa_0261 [Halopiger xanaduensis SH-6]